MNARPNRDEGDTHYPAGPIVESDLSIDEEGYIYHLQVKPEQIAPDILLVGDPGSAEMIGSTFLPVPSTVGFNGTANQGCTDSGPAE